jgi:hypothetical protein
MRTSRLARALATRNAATLTVVSNTPPTGSITSPSAGTLYRAGDTITCSGTGTDTQDRTLAASRFTWQVDLHHCDGNPHVHPFIPATTGATSASPQTFGGKTYNFGSWSDRGKATHTITTPDANTNYTAAFKIRGKRPTRQGRHLGRASLQLAALVQLRMRTTASEPT